MYTPLETALQFLSPSLFLFDPFDSFSLADKQKTIMSPHKVNALCLFSRALPGVWTTSQGLLEGHRYRRTGICRQIREKHELTVTLNRNRQLD
jgi:hypothetical protein